MQLFSSHKSPAIIKKRFRFNPHRYWVIFLGAMVLILTAELMYFSWFFLSTTTLLDATVTASHSTNASQIREMQHRLDTTEAAVNARIMGAPETSQKAPAVLQ